jgi:hypothetical protein
MKALSPRSLGKGFEKLGREVVQPVSRLRAVRVETPRQRREGFDCIVFSYGIASSASLNRVSGHILGRRAGAAAGLAERRLALALA